MDVICGSSPCPLSFGLFCPLRPQASIAHSAIKPSDNWHLFPIRFQSRWEMEEGERGRRQIMLKLWEGDPAWVKQLDPLNDDATFAWCRWYYVADSMTQFTPLYRFITLWKSLCITALRVVNCTINQPSRCLLKSKPMTQVNLGSKRVLKFLLSNEIARKDRNPTSTWVIGSDFSRRCNSGSMAPFKTRRAVTSRLFQSARINGAAIFRARAVRIAPWKRNSPSLSFFLSFFPSIHCSRDKKVSCQSL